MLTDEPLTPEEEELIDEAISTVLAVFSEELNMHYTHIDFDSNIQSLFHDNLFLFGHALIAVHEDLEIPMSYERLSEFDMFHTVREVCEYFILMLAQKRGVVS